MKAEDQKFLLKLDLQAHADDELDNQDEFDVGGIDEDQDFSGGEDDLLSALKSLKDLEDEDEDEDDSQDDNLDSDEDEDESEDEQTDDSEDDEEDNLDQDQDTKPKKKVQSKEENAKFAAQRREAELQARLQAEMAQRPEFQLAKQLSEQFGKPVEQIMAELQEAQLRKQAEQQKVPYELLKKQQESDNQVRQLQQEINNMKFQQWKTQVEADKVRLQGEYAVLSSEDLDVAVNYVLENNINMKLEDAVYAVHGKKIIDSLAKKQVQDNLAEQSGRKKKTPLAPNNGKPAKVNSLTAQEQAIARAFGMSDADYQKYK